MQNIKYFEKFLEKKAYQAFDSWYQWLSMEKRLSEHTADSYFLDLKAFFEFLYADFGHLLSLKDLMREQNMDLLSIELNFLKLVMRKM